MTSYTETDILCEQMVYMVYTDEALAYNCVCRPMTLLIPKSAGKHLPYARLIGDKEYSQSRML